MPLQQETYLKSSLMRPQQSSKLSNLQLSCLLNLPAPTCHTLALASLDVGGAKRLGGVVACLVGEHLLVQTGVLLGLLNQILEDDLNIEPSTSKFEKLYDQVSCGMWYNIQTLICPDRSRITSEPTFVFSLI